MPSNAGAFLLFLCALWPGVLYLRIVERRAIRRRRTDVVQTVELAVIGAACTSIGLGVGILISGFWVAPAELVRLAQVSRWTDGRAVAAVGVYLAMTLLLSLGLATVVIWLVGSRGTFTSAPASASAFLDFLGGPRGRQASSLYIVAVMTDGVSYGGQLQAVDVADDVSEREISLVAPIVRSDTSQRRLDLPYDTIILARRDIQTLSITALPKK